MRNFAYSASHWENAPKLSEDLAVSEHISRLTSPDDKILVFGNPAFYFLSKREPASKYLFYSWRFIESPIRDEYLNNLKRSLQDNSTKLVAVADEYRTDISPELLNVIQQEYHEVEVVPYSYNGQVRLYERSP